MTAKSTTSRSTVLGCLLLGMGILVASAPSCARSAKQAGSTSAADASQADAALTKVDTPEAVADTGASTGGVPGSGGTGGLAGTGGSSGADAPKGAGGSGGAADAALDAPTSTGGIGQGGGSGGQVDGEANGGSGGSSTGGTRDASAGTGGGGAGGGFGGTRGTGGEGLPPGVGGATTSPCVPGPAPDLYGSPSAPPTPPLTADLGALCIKSVAPTTCAPLATSPLATVCQPNVLANDHEFILWGGNADSCGSGNIPLSGLTAQGAVYDTTTGTWTSIATSGAPLWQTDSLVLLSGRKLVVLGGSGNSMSRRSEEHTSELQSP
jgi:hypothetical protein